NLNKHLAIDESLFTKEFKELPYSKNTSLFLDSSIFQSTEMHA
ncbi:19442_t:CDS:1, partial [Rhizophagus irregularis]